MNEFHHTKKFEKLLLIDPNLNVNTDYIEEEADNVNNDFSCLDDESESVLNVMHSTDEILHKQDFSDIEESDEEFNTEIFNSQLKNYDNFFSKSPLDYVSLQSLKSLTNFGINIIFMRYSAYEWPTHKSFVDATKIASNIKSTSIYTEQLVGRVSRLNDSCLLKNKDDLNGLALSAVDKN